MTTIRANITRMFENVAPEYVSGSQFELGDQAGRITWSNAMRIAGERKRWLRSPVREAADNMRDWARETGAWEEAEIAAWSITECLALFVQNVASELRTCLDADNNFDDVAAVCANTDWNQESEYPIGTYYVRRGSTLVEYYTGI